MEKPGVQRRGVLLPQHLELRDHYLEALLDECLGDLAPFAWGLLQLTMDPAALAAGWLRVTAASARFPSGEIASLNAGEPPLDLALPPAGSADYPLDAFLGLADASDHGPNAGDVGGLETTTRYFTVPESAQGRSPALRPRLRLYLGGENAPEDSLRIAHVRSTNGGLQIDAEVLPPMLWPLPGTFLPGALAAVINALTARQSQLLAARRERVHEPLSFAAEETPPLVALSVIQQALAALNHPPSRRGLHPRESHRILSELLGAIEALEGQAGPIPTYDHRNAGPAFRTIVNRLVAAIPTLARPPHEALSFTRRDTHTFALKLPDPAVLRRPVHLVLMGGERTQLEQGVPAYGKLASESMMPRIVQTAVRGIELAPDFDPPPSLPSSAKSACFRLNTRSDYWGDVLERGSMVFYLPNAPKDLRVTLYILNAKERGGR